MSYRILEVHQKYSENKLTLIAVLWVSNPDTNWVRASYLENEPMGGYGFLTEKDELSQQLIQRVDGQGRNLPDNLKKKFFPGKKLWER